jgi:hypothetical protein
MNTCTASILKNSNDENLHDKYVVVTARQRKNITDDVQSGL